MCPYFLLIKCLLLKTSTYSRDNKRAITRHRSHDRWYQPPLSTNVTWSTTCADSSFPNFPSYTYKPIKFTSNSITKHYSNQNDISQRFLHTQKTHNKIKQFPYSARYSIRQQWIVERAFIPREMEWHIVQLLRLIPECNGPQDMNRTETMKLPLQRTQNAQVRAEVQRGILCTDILVWCYGKCSEMPHTLRYKKINSLLSFF